MLLHNAPLFRIYFGNAEDMLDPKIYLNFSSNTDLLQHSYFHTIQKKLQLDYLFFFKQTHSASGLVVTENNALTLRPFKDEGDFLITHLSHVGLGVMTADCLPIVLYDTRNHAIAIVHAGWRGSAQGIVINVVRAMQQQYNTDLDSLQVFFGPAAKVCCYEVSPDLITEFDAYPYAQQAFHKHGEHTFFDLPGFNKLQLESIGVKKEAFHFGYTICTICNDKFCSYRRQKGKSGRQMTVVSLK